MVFEIVLAQVMLIKYMMYISSRTNKSYINAIVVKACQVRQICWLIVPPPLFAASRDQDNGVIEHSSCTMFTVQTDDGIVLKPNRPALVVSSTSW